MENEKRFMNRIYSNRVSVILGPNDFAIQFSQHIEHEQEEVASVMLSPQTAKDLLELLSNAMAQYEDIFGPVMNEPRDGNGIIETK